MGDRHCSNFVTCGQLMTADNQPIDTTLVDQEMFQIALGLSALYLAAQWLGYFPDRGFLIASLLTMAGLVAVVSNYYRSSNGADQ